MGRLRREVAELRERFALRPPDVPARAPVEPRPPRGKPIVHARRERSSDVAQLELPLSA
ncbi:MAG TPA: hypothetical protein VFI15_12120 [Candidatus Limnocylindrales bacterium]|nr:hypothetical protein [Candidatus Limnocylindrales bacterium]